MRNKLITAGVVMTFALVPLVQATAATLPTATKASLVFMVEEEKMARDVYITLYAKTGLRQISNIYKAEQSHMDLMRSLLTTYGIKDPTIGKAVGKFQSSTITTLYKKLVADGSVSLIAALDAGIAVENKDIADLNKLMKTTPPADIILVLDCLLAGSYNHLNAFTI